MPPHIVDHPLVRHKLGLRRRESTSTSEFRSLSKEVAKRGVTVNCVSPGFIDTDFIRDLPEDQAKAYKNTVPMRRFGKAEEVAQAILFLAARESAYITGATLEVTGGL